MTNHVVTKQASDVTSHQLDSRLPMSLRVVLDKDVYDRVWAMAGHMARSPGLVGPHLLGNQDACFSVILVAMDFRLSPYMVAKNTFSAGRVEVNGKWVPGSLGFNSALVFAICEASGRLDGPPKLEYFGDWTKVMGKHQLVESTKKDENNFPRKIARATYTPEDEEGLGVVVKLRLKGEEASRDFTFLLRQAHPRNSTLWATDPMTQLGYAALRRAVNTRAPQILMGLPFEDDVPQQQYVGPEQAKDVTPYTPTSEPDKLFDLLNGDDTTISVAAPEQQSDLPLITDDALGTKNDQSSSREPVLIDADGVTYSVDKDGLTAWREKWMTDFRLPENDPEEVLTKFIPALSDAAILFGDRPEVVRKLEEIGDWARALVEQEKGAV